VGLIGESVQLEALKRDPSLLFQRTEQVSPEAVKQLRARQADVWVLLFQGSKAEAREIAKLYPDFDVILCRDEVDEPSSKAEMIGTTMLVATGHKGRYVGLVAFLPGREFFHGIRPPTNSTDLTEVLTNARSRYTRLQYQLVPLTEHYELPDDETNLARERMKDYVVRIHRELSPGATFLTKYPRSSHPVQVDFPEARYVGSAACKQCHPKAYETWSRSGHSHAYETLVNYGRPFVLREEKGPKQSFGNGVPKQEFGNEQPAKIIGRQFDPDCVRCHVTGFEYRTGFVDEQKTPHLLGNGCENCHGPASLHVANPRNVEFSRPLRLSITTVENRCRHCHDGDNDPHFDLKTYWPKIKHGRE
jgi:hypothetical protein